MMNARSQSLVVSAVAVSALTLGLAGDSYGAVIKAGTNEAWNGYVERSQNALAQQSADPTQLLSIEPGSPTLEPVQSHDGFLIRSPRGGGIPVPYGLVHHWYGTVFLPNTHIPELLVVLQDYDNYSAVYHPGVVESKLISREGDEFTYRLKFIQKGFGIKAGLIGDFKTTYCRVTDDSGYSVTRAINLTELADPGTPDEHALSLSQSHGYVERAFTVARYRQVQGGVYLQLETLTLSRDVPAAIRWMVSPLIQRFSRQTMADTLEKLRTRVLGTGTIEAVAATNSVQDPVPAQ
jgi:hypothetical protein